jgi:hypothetical protein
MREDVEYPTVEAVARKRLIETVIDYSHKSVSVSDL